MAPFLSKLTQAPVDPRPVAAKHDLERVAYRLGWERKVTIPGT
jgi:hypothetical protein